MLSKETTPTMLNKSTGSAFFILKENADLRCGFRLWIQGSPAILGFRLRVESMPSFTPPNGVLKDYLTEVFPEVKWSKISTNYASILGSIETTVPVGDPDGVLKALTANDVASKIYDCLIDRLRSMDFPFDREEFEEFVWSLVTDEIATLKGSNNPDPTLITFKTPEGAAMYKDGFAVQLTNGGTTPESPSADAVAPQAAQPAPVVSEVQAEPENVSEDSDGVQSL